MKIEIAVLSRQFDHLFQLNQLFTHAPMRDQALDRANPQVVLLAKFHQLGQARHRSVIVQNFTKHTSRLQSGHAGEIDRCFSMPGAAQHPTIFRPQSEDVSRLNQILGRRFGIGYRANSCGAIMRTNSCRHIVGGIDRDGEVGPVHFPVLHHHSLQAELFRPLVRNRHANQTAAVLGHKIHRVGRYLFRRHDEISLVFAVGVVGYDHYPPLCDVL